MVLGKMKETAEAYLGHKVTHAVVTVPACKSIPVVSNGTAYILKPEKISTMLRDRQPKMQASLQG